MNHWTKPTDPIKEGDLDFAFYTKDGTLHSVLLVFDSCLGTSKRVWEKSWFDHHYPLFVLTLF